MKKKLIKGVLLGLLLLNLTGCVKFNVNIGINKDKSMDFSMIYAFDTQYLGDQQIFSDEDLNNIKENGFKVDDYSENSMKGITLTRVIPNIDLVSTIANYTEFDLAAITEEKQDSFLFKIDKGFFKNKYTAKIKFDSSESNLSTDMNTDDNTIVDDNIEEDSNENNLEDKTSEDTVGDAINYTGSDDNKIMGIENEENAGDNNDENNENTDNQENVDDEASIDLDSNIDFSQIMAGMDLSVKVTLPYSAISHNATTTNNDDKELTWALTNNGIQYMEFEFELYNMTTIYLVCGGAGLGLILLGLVIVIVIKKKNEVKNAQDNMGNNGNSDNADSNMGNSNLGSNNIGNNNIGNEINNINNQGDIKQNLTSTNEQENKNMMIGSQTKGSLTSQENNLVDTNQSNTMGQAISSPVINGLVQSQVEMPRPIVKQSIMNNNASNNIPSNSPMENGNGIMEINNRMPNSNNLYKQENTLNQGMVGNNSPTVNSQQNSNVLTSGLNTNNVVGQGTSVGNIMHNNNSNNNNNNNSQLNEALGNGVGMTQGKDGQGLVTQQRPVIDMTVNKNENLGNGSAVAREEMKTNPISAPAPMSMPSASSYIHIPGQETNGNEVENKIPTNKVAVNQSQGNLVGQATGTNNENSMDNTNSNVQPPTPVMIDANFRNVVNGQNQNNSSN